MGHCCSTQKPIITTITVSAEECSLPVDPAAPSPPPSSVIGASPLPEGVRQTPLTPARKFRFPPPSPAKPIMKAIFRRKKPAAEKTIPEEDEESAEEEKPPLEKSFGYPKNFPAKYELGKEIGQGHFGNTHWAKVKRGELKGQAVAVKIISKSKMTTAVSVEDVQREVKILKALSGHENLVKFYEAFEDSHNVYIVMELCEGGELLDRILSRGGGRYAEEGAKRIVVQILSIVSFCHLQGVVHRDLKPENFLFTTRDEDSPLKMIDFGLSEYIKPNQRLNDIVGSAYYVAPEVLYRSYGREADIWSIGVITYILLCGSRPFWAPTESGIFRSVIRLNPNFDDSPWPSVSPDAKDFVKRLLNKDPRKRMTASQALCHPWLRDEKRAIPLDILIYKLAKSYARASPLKRAALKALSKALTEDDITYLRAQFTLLEPKDGYVSPINFKEALMRNATDAMDESNVLDIFNTMEPLSYKKMNFDEFCASAISIYQLEAREGWDAIAATAFQHFEKEGNRVVSVFELLQEMNLDIVARPLLKDCIRSSDGKLSSYGYTKYLHGVRIHSSNTNTRHC